jgi:hypothetical protein
MVFGKVNVNQTAAGPTRGIKMIVILWFFNSPFVLVTALQPGGPRPLRRPGPRRHAGQNRRRHRGQRRRRLPNARRFCLNLQAAVRVARRAGPAACGPATLAARGGEGVHVRCGLGQLRRRAPRAARVIAGMGGLCASRPSAMLLVRVHAVRLGSLASSESAMD